MKQLQAMLTVLSIVSALTIQDVSAQIPLLPSSIGIDLGMGARFPTALAPSSCGEGLPVAAGVRLGWSPRRYIQIQATASTFGSVRWVDCPFSPCDPEGPCLRSNGIGEELNPVGIRLLFEPKVREAQENIRLIVGVGRLIGDGESYGMIGAGFRFGDRAGLSVTLDFERLFFHAPVQVFEHPTNEVVSSSRDTVRLSLLRIGLEWGF